MTELRRCRWCRRALPERKGRGRPRQFCSSRCRQWDWVARQRAHELALSDGELVIAKATLDELHDDLYVLACAVDDVERDPRRPQALRRRPPPRPRLAPRRRPPPPQPRRSPHRRPIPQFRHDGLTPRERGPSTERAPVPAGPGVTSQRRRDPGERPGRATGQPDYGRHGRGAGMPAKPDDPRRPPAPTPWRP